MRKDGGIRGYRNYAEEIAGVRSVIQRARKTHSWASATSPVIAEKPRNGALGRTNFSTRKQSIQSSPGLGSS